MANGKKRGRGVKMPGGPQRPNLKSLPQRPPVVGPDGVIGQVRPEAKDRIMAAQGKQRELSFQLGQLDLQMDKVRRDFHQVGAEAQQIINAEAQRLGIPDGMPWQITMDGKAILVPQQVPMGMPPGVQPSGRPAPPPPPSQPEPEEEDDDNEEEDEAEAEASEPGDGIEEIPPEEREGGTEE